jgi:hypothetical protein
MVHPDCNHLDGRTQFQRSTNPGYTLVCDVNQYTSQHVAMAQTMLPWRVLPRTCHFQLKLAGTLSSAYLPARLFDALRYDP